MSGTAEIDTIHRRHFLEAPDYFPIAVQRVRDHPPKTLHRHDFSELVLVTSGRGIHWTEQEDYPLQAGDVFVVLKGQAHGYRDTENFRIINLLFDFDLLGLPLYDLSRSGGFHCLFTLSPNWRLQPHFRSRLHLPAREFRAVLDAVDMLEEEVRRRQPGYQACAAGIFGTLVARLSRLCERHAGGIPPPALRLANVLAYMEAEFRVPHTLSELSARACMSRSAFCQAFREAMGVPPMAYLVRLRLREAVRRLRETSDTITRIAADSGFPDSNYMARLFRREMHCTPRQFRTRRLIAPSY